MKLPAQLPPDTCWLPFPGTGAELRLWQAQHAAGYALRARLPRNVRLHADDIGIDQHFAHWRLLGESGAPALSGLTWCAALDPVVLAADQTDVRVVQWPVGDLAPDAAATLSADVATHLRGDDDARIAGTTLWQASATRWYLMGSGDAPQIHNAQPDRILGQALRDLPTGGADAAQWRRISTEIQMLFHAHPANAQRTANGRAAVTGLWWFGTASVADATQSRQLPTLCSDDPLWRGCWHACGAQANVQAQDGAQETLSGIALAGRIDAVFPMAVAALAAGQLGAIVIGADSETLTLSRPSWWQRLIARRST